MADSLLLENVLDKLDKTRRSGNGYSALCPAHPDTDASMSVKIGDNGSVVLNCHKGCAKEDIVAAIGMKMQDLWPEKTEAQKTGKKTFVEAYDYVDAEGTLIFQVTKWMNPDGKKTFTQRKPMAHGEWEYSTTGLNKPIYRLPRVNTAIANNDPIYVVEGEKDVHTLEALGLTATCNPGGALAWLPKHTKQLSGANQVFLVADNDAVGYKHVTNIQAELEGQGTSSGILAPPEGYKDVSDMIEAGTPLSALISPEITPEKMDQYTELMADMRSLAGKDWSIDKKLARARSMIDAHQYNSPDLGRLIDWQTFLKEPVDEYDWVIPGLLEREDRVIVVAAEGVGKTMLARQIALMSAAGTHPFTRAPMDKVRTLFVDLENPERIIRRTSTKIMDAVQMLRPSYKIDAHLYSKPDGINILNPEDRVQLENIFEQTQPDLVCLGPLYKTFIDPGGRTSESVTTEAAMYLDYLRVTYNCALWLEHHAPLGGSDSSRQLRPFGSSVWSRWPEFGITLQPDETIEHKYELRHFRGARDEREWPAGLNRGAVFPFDPIWA